MSDPNTLRVLEIDGGGERGYLALKFFNQFLQCWNITSEDIWKHFDVICGTSIGGILALALAAGRTPDQLLPFFTEQGPYIFSTNGTASSTASIFTKAGVLLLPSVFGNTFYGTSAGTPYGSALLYKTIRNMLKEDPNDPTSRDLTLQDLKTNVIIPAYQYDTLSYVTFSNLNYAEFIGNTALASDVALSTSAAPFYLPIYSFGGHSYSDGGIYQNNPAGFGRVLAQSIKKNAKRMCVLSIGTGLGQQGFYDPASEAVEFARLIKRSLKTQLLVEPSMLIRHPELNRVFFDPPEEDEEEAASVELIFKLFNIATTGGQESVARTLLLDSLYTRNKLYYYRFQPRLDTVNNNTELDNTTTEILRYYEQTAQSWFENDITNISNFLGHLTA
jgi:uncharacterized protein